MGTYVDVCAFPFPSKKKMAKLPVIKLDGDGARFVSWLLEHEEIDTQVPPLYQNFVIEMGHITILVCYTDDAVRFYAKIWESFDGEEKLALSICVNYSGCSNREFLIRHSKISKTPTTEREQEFYERLAKSIAWNVIAIQAYILYHKPEIIEQIYAPDVDHKSNETQKKKRVVSQPIRIRKTKIKRITLTEQDKPPKEIHYNKLSWSVRGHYRHVGKDKHLVYIQPTVRNRNGKKYSVKAQTYEIKEESES